MASRLLRLGQVLMVSVVVLSCGVNGVSFEDQKLTETLPPPPPGPAPKPDPQPPIPIPPTPRYPTLLVDVFLLSDQSSVFKSVHLARFDSSRTVSYAQLANGFRITSRDLWDYATAVGSVFFHGLENCPISIRLVMTRYIPEEEEDEDDDELRGAVTPNLFKIQTAAYSQTASGYITTVLDLGNIDRPQTFEACGVIFTGKFLVTELPPE